MIESSPNSRIFVRNDKHRLPSYSAKCFFQRGRLSQAIGRIETKEVSD